MLAAALRSPRSLPPDAYELRNLGLAQLENERPADAEATWRKLGAAAPREPLAHADLAIALLRQQKFDDALAAIDAALKLAPGRPDLVAIRGEVLLWKNDRDAALVELDRAAKAAPNDLEILYRLYRHASSMRGPAAESSTQFAVERLAELRPENLFVMLRVGQAAIARADRARATGAYLRIRELLWQAQPIAQTALEGVLDALEKNDFEGARVPSLRLENVLKVTPMFRGGLVELSSGIQGVPVTRFADEPPPTTFGKAVPVELRARKIEGAAKGTAALVAADLDGDDQIDLARLIAAPSPALEIRFGRAGFAKATTLPAPADLTSLLAVDLDNDGALDLLGAGGRLVLWRGDGKGGFRDDSAAFGLAGRRDSLAVAFDYDQEGDLDLATAGEGGRLDLLRNALSGPLDAVGDRAFAGAAKAAAPGQRIEQAPAGAAPTSPGAPRALRASDLDRDGDPDLVVLGERGLRVLDNLRQGRFVDRTAEHGLAKTPGSQALAIADLDNDGWPDLALAGPGITLLAQPARRVRDLEGHRRFAGRRRRVRCRPRARRRQRRPARSRRRVCPRIAGAHAVVARDLHAATVGAATAAMKQRSPPPISIATAISISCSPAPTASLASRMPAATPTPGSTCGCAASPRVTTRTTGSVSAPPPR